MYDIDRKMASRLLKTSIRTVDRYIVAKKLSIERRDGRIWLNKEEIMGLKKKKKVDRGLEYEKEKSIDKGGYMDVDMSIDTVDRPSTSEFNQTPRGAIQKFSNQKSVYQKLFEEAKEELKHKQELLEGANYRVGQLEAMLKDTVPLLDHQRALTQERARQEELIQSFHDQETKVAQAEKRLKEEAVDKKLYLILLFIILLLQPLWLFLAYK